jgi:hypothetical protein
MAYDYAPRCVPNRFPRSCIGYCPSPRVTPFRPAGDYILFHGSRCVDTTIPKGDSIDSVRTGTLSDATTTCCSINFAALH